MAVNKKADMHQKMFEAYPGLTPLSTMLTRLQPEKPLKWYRLYKRLKKWLRITTCPECGHHYQEKW